MLRVVSEHLQRQSSLERVVFVLFDEPTRRIFEQAWLGMRTAEGGSESR
ncbi:MAG: hypothetical protein HY648_06030 [Acidobacteria bacterium]|nr:hypothetical protein [Acidobacteriota bacterium]